MSLKQKFVFLLLILVMILITMPRFNANDYCIKFLTGELTDAVEYAKITSYFRGYLSKENLKIPFTYRPLIPFLASLLPFDELTSINIINIISLIIALLYVIRTLTFFGFEFRYKIIGGGLFAISFPSFYYTTVGLIDPVLVCLLTAGFYYLLSNKWYHYTIIVFVGVFVKETIIILLIILVGYSFMKRRMDTKVNLILGCGIILYIITSYASRTIILDSSEYIWLPSFEYFVNNISRPKSILSFVLTFGVPGFLSVLALKERKSFWFKRYRSEASVLIIGIFLTVILFGYSMISAYADGRFIWVSYPFSIPLAVYIIRKYENKNSKIKFSQK